MGNWQLIKEDKEYITAISTVYHILEKVKGTCFFSLAGIRNNSRRGEAKCEVSLEVSIIMLIVGTY